MPMYDYRCTTCGDFRELRPMAESRTPRPCPHCGEVAERALSAPFLAGVDPLEGTRGSRAGSGRVPWRSVCGPGCSHAFGCTRPG